MTTPAYLISIILSTLYGSAFHLYMGGTSNKLILYLIASWMGFAIGHNISSSTEASIYAIGPLNAGMATTGSILALVFSHWLVQNNNSNNTDT
tara:strand:+ start:4057 stop:4335 length:279 start_codon:yes stop_codon:yes gene_type:complete